MQTVFKQEGINLQAGYVVTIQCAAGEIGTVKVKPPSGAEYTKPISAGTMTIGPFMTDCYVLLCADRGGVQFEVGSDNAEMDDVVRFSTNITGGIELKAKNLTISNGLDESLVVTSPVVIDNQVIATDYYNYIAMAENTAYVFGRKTLASGVVLRVAKSDGAETNGVDVTTLKLSDNTTTITQAVILCIWAWDDYQIMQVKDGPSGKCLLYKSVNNFATVGANAAHDDGFPVYAIGWNTNKTVEANEISIMAPWSLTRGKNTRGEDLIIFGQYNVNASRTPGGANDWSSVIVSRRDAEAGSFETLLENNTAGTTIVRHCHTVQQDPYTKEFWILYGDQGTSAIYVWDGVHPISPNTKASDAASYPGWRGMDSTNNPTKNANTGQLTILLFQSDEIICPLDHGTTDARGIYSLSRDLTRYERIWDGSINGQPLYHSLYSADICPVTGTAVVSTILEPGGTSPSADFTLWIFTSTKQGGYRDWKRVARYMLDTTLPINKSFQSFRFRANGDLWMGATNGAAKDISSSTAVCRVVGVYDELYGEAVVHPVYWIDPVSGSDTNNGNRPSTAFKTLGYAMTGGRVCCSSLVKILSGATYEGTSVKTFQYNLATRPAQVNYPIIIEGVDENRTIISGNIASYSFVQPAVSAYSLTFRKMRLENTGGGMSFATGTALSRSIVNTFEDVSMVTSGSPLRVESGTLVLRRWTADVGTFGRAVQADYASDYAIDMTAGIVRGGQTAVAFRGVWTSECKVENVTGIGQSVGLVYAVASAVNFPTVKNCCASGSAVAQDSRTTKTNVDALVDYNAATAASSSLIGGNQHSIVVGDVGLIGTTGAPNPTSVLIGAGNVSAGPATDRVGFAYKSPKNIGAFA